MELLRRKIHLIAILALVAGGHVQAAGNAFAVNEKICKRPAPSELDWLDASAWAPYAQYIRVCKVLNGRSSPALLLISVWADLYYAERSSGSATVEMPRPLLFTPDGKHLGELPVNFPSDPPSELVIRFTNWKRGFPYEIRLCVATPTASGDHALPPLRFMPATMRYEQVAGAGATNSSGDCNAR